MSVSYFHRNPERTKCTAAEFKGDEFNDGEIKNICCVMNFVDEKFKKYLPSADVIVTHQTTYSPGQLCFTITTNRPLTDEEVRIIEHIVGSNLGMSVYHLNRSLYRSLVDVFPEWDEAVMSWK